MTLPAYTYLNDLYAWIAHPGSAGYTRSNVSGEGGVDFFTPVGTPVYAVATGPIVGLGLNNVDAHGVLTTRVNVPGQGPQDLYYQHIDTVAGLAVGQMVTAGQLIGYIADPGSGPKPQNWSPHIEMGFNADWGGPWNGGNHPAGAQWIGDPRPWLASLVGSSVSGYGSGTQYATTGFNLPGPLNTLNNLLSAGGAIGDWIGNPLRIIKFVIGVILIGAALLLFLSPEGEKVGKQALQTGGLMA